MTFCFHLLTDAFHCQAPALRRPLHNVDHGRRKGNLYFNIFSGRQQQPLILQHNFVKPSQHCKVKKKQNSILSPIRLLIFLLQPTRKMRNELILFQAESQPEPQGADLESQVGAFYDDGDNDRNSIDIRLTTSFPTKSASWGALISLQAI